jgi:hypothetical protein
MRHTRLKKTGIRALGTQSLVDLHPDMRQRLGTTGVFFKPGMTAGNSLVVRWELK